MYILAVWDIIIIDGYNAIIKTNSKFKLGDKNRFPRKKATKTPRDPTTAEGNLKAHSETPNIQTDIAIRYNWPIPLTYNMPLG
jgi:hypothetical protein